MENPLRGRSILGIAAVALVLGLCVFAVWSVRSRPHAPVPTATAAADSSALQADNDRLRAEVVRLTAERDAALARVAAKAPVAPAPPAEPVVAQPAPPAAPAAAPPAPPSNGFSEPQTFSSDSTANVHS